MDFSSLINILPPVFTSIGGLIPLLLSSSPIKMPDSTKSLLAVIFVVFIWVVYLLIMILGEKYTFYSTTLTLSSLIIGLLFFTGLLVLVKNTNKRPMVLNFLFVFGILFIMIGFTNYVASSGKTIFIFEKVKNVLK